MVRQLVDLGHGSVGREGAEEHIELVNGKRGPRSGDGGVVFGDGPKLPRQAGQRVAVG